MRAGSGIVARLGTYVAVQGAPSRVEAVLGVKTTPMGAGEPIAIASLFLAEMAAHERRTQAQCYPRKREHFSQVAGDRVEPKALALGDALRAGLQELKEPE